MSACFPMQWGVVVLRSVLAKTIIIFVAGFTLAAWAHAGVVLDETNAVLSSGASLSYDPGATPGSPSAPNIIAFAGSGSAQWTVNLVPGQKYLLTASRCVSYQSDDLGYEIRIDGTLYMNDWASCDNQDQSNTYVAMTFLGYYVPASTTTILQVDDAGPGGAKLNYITLDPTYDVYFDENGSLEHDGLCLQRSIALLPPNYYGSMPTAQRNGIIFEAASVSGTLTLTPGTTYNVYTSRQVYDSNMNYDIALGGMYFATDWALPPSPDQHDQIIEAFLGTYTPPSASTPVTLTNPGDFGARVAYIRFQATASGALGSLKSYPDGTCVSTSAPLVVSVGSGCFSDGSIYVEAPNRACGIRVAPPSNTDCSTGDTVNVTGDLNTDVNGQRYIDASAVNGVSTGNLVRPLGMSNKSLKTTGLDPSGMLVMVWGKIVSVTPSNVDIDDGGSFPIRIVFDGLENPLTTTFNVGSYAIVTGVAGMTTGRVRAVRPRSDSDIVVLSYN